MRRLRQLGCWLATAGLVMLLLWGVSQPATAQPSGIDGQLRLLLSIINRLAVGLSTVSELLEENYTHTFSDGTGANQAKALWHDDRRLAASATEDLDFSGSLNDAFGASLTCTSLKAIVIKALATNTNNVLIGAGNTTMTTLFSATNDRIILRPGGVFMFTAPDATGATMTAGSSDVLTIANSAGSTVVDYEISVLCEE